MAIAETKPGGTETWNYQYDDLKRLTRAHLTNASGNNIRLHEYSYDRNGNRLEHNVTIGAGSQTPKSYTYNALDQMRIETVSAVPSKRYDWDEMGRMLAEGPVSAAAREREYRWSVDDRLLGVTIRDSGPERSIAYAYDPRGTLTSRKETATGEPGDSRGLLVDYENPTGYSQSLAEVSPDGVTPLRDHVYDESGIVAQRGANPDFFHNDHLGTVRALTGQGGSVPTGGQFAYEPYGLQTAGDSSLTPYAFTGQWKDGKTGEQYHRARWYHAVTARFDSADRAFDYPNGFGSSNGYVGNSPISRIDPSSLLTLMEIGKVALIVTIIALIALIGVLIWDSLRRAGKSAITLNGNKRVLELGYYVPGSIDGGSVSINGINSAVLLKDGFVDFEDRELFLTPTTFSFGQADVVIIETHGGYLEPGLPSGDILWLDALGVSSRSVIQLEDNAKFSVQSASASLATAAKKPRLIVLLACGVGHPDIRGAWHSALGATTTVFIESGVRDPQNPANTCLIYGKTYNPALTRFFRSFVAEGKTVQQAVDDGNSVNVADHKLVLEGDPLLTIERTWTDAGKPTQ